MQSDIYSVTRLNTEIKGMLESNPVFRNVFVQGEISNYKAHSSGHHYMTLKDDGAAINAVLFRSDAVRLRFRPENGMKVIARGRVSSFPKSGQVQLYLADMMPDGAGALHLAFEQLKQRLQAEGLFAQAHKRILPRMPETIALVTSPTGAAVHDMLRILARRWPLARIQLYPALVQGADAAADLRRALRLANTQGQADVIIIGRGGGSLEDLWAFNDEGLARDIYASSIPVVSAVGHEPDVTISDFVADLRAPTPSGAAELVTPDGTDVRAFLLQSDAVLGRGLARAIERSRKQFAGMQERFALRTPQHAIVDKRMLLAHQVERLLLRSPQYTIARKRERLSMLSEQVHKLSFEQIENRRSRLARGVTALDALSPLKVLTRGYAVALDKQGTAVRDSASLHIGDTLQVRFAQGEALCRVEETREDQWQKK